MLKIVFCYKMSDHHHPFFVMFVSLFLFLFSFGIICYNTPPQLVDNTGLQLPLCTHKGQYY